MSSTPELPAIAYCHLLMKGFKYIYILDKVFTFGLLQLAILFQFI